MTSGERVSLVIPPALAAEAVAAAPAPPPGASFADRRELLLEHARAHGFDDAVVTPLPALGGYIARGPSALYDDGCAGVADRRAGPGAPPAPSPPQTTHLGPRWYLGPAGLSVPRGGGDDGAGDVVVGLIDSGLRAGEAELTHLGEAGRLHFASFDARGHRGDGAPRDVARGHGTTSAALVAGATLGVEPRAHLAVALAERQCDEPGSPERGWAGLAAIWAAYDWLLSAELTPGRRGADVICVNLESHSRVAARFLALPIRWARHALGILTVVPAGNRGLSDLASCDDALAVGAHGWDGRALPSSGSGTSFRGAPKPDLLAPGFRVAGFREAPGRLVSGTSCAAPLVAGAAAWLLRRRPELRRAPEGLTRALAGLCEGAPPGAAEHGRSAWGRLKFGRHDWAGSLPAGGKGVGDGLRTLQGRRIRGQAG